MKTPPELDRITDAVLAYRPKDKQPKLHEDFVVVEGYNGGWHINLPKRGSIRLGIRDGARSARSLAGRG